MLYIATVGEIPMRVKYFQKNNMGMFRESYGKVKGVREGQRDA